MKNETKAFTTFLQTRGFRPQTVYSYVTLLGRFFDWCNIKKRKPSKASLDDLYSYKKDLIARNLKTQTVQQHLSILKHYYVSIGREDNPGLLVKHTKREQTLPEKLLSEEELTELYRSLSADTMVQRRDKAMLGITIFQGVKREELALLELDYVDLDRACIYIPSTARTNSRSVALHPMQMKDLLAYVYDYRPVLLRESLKENTSRLFFSMGKGNRLNNSIQRKMQNLKRWHPALLTLIQIRESRMSLWVKEHGIRKAQYFAGIKYTSSMLRYKTQDIEQLKKKLAVVHPMERLGVK